MVLGDHSEVFVIGIGGMAVRRPDNAGAKDRRKEQKYTECSESFFHSNAPGSILRRGGWRGEEFGLEDVSKVTGRK